MHIKVPHYNFNVYWGEVETRPGTHLERREDLVVVLVSEYLPRCVGREVNLSDELTASQELGRPPHFDFPGFVAPESLYIRNVYRWHLHGVRISVSSENRTRAAARYCVDQSRGNLH